MSTLPFTTEMDAQRAAFLNALAANIKTKNGVILDEFESSFLASWLKAYRPYQFWTDNRRAAADRMWMRFGALINVPHPADQVAQGTRPQDLPAPPGRCMFFKRDETRRQDRCGEPAAFQNAKGFLYCASCAEVATTTAKRVGQHLHLNPLSGTNVLTTDGHR